MTNTTTDAAEARAREVLESVEWQMSNFRPADGETGAQCHERRLVAGIAKAITEATAEAASGAGEREELAAFGASEAAGYQYPGADQAAERAAFCAGAAHAASLLPATDPAMVLDGNDIWEALFGIMRGNVPDEMTEEVCSQLAAALAAAPTIPATGEANHG